MNKKRSAKLRMVWRRCSNCGTTLKVPYKDIRKDADGDEMDIFCFDCICKINRFNDMIADSEWLGLIF